MQKAVLVVDDEGGPREDLTSALESAGWTVYACRHASDVFNGACFDNTNRLSGRFSLENVHVAVLDWQLPGCDGIALGKELLKKSTEPLFLLLVSAVAGLKEADLALSEDVFEKCFDKTDLKDGAKEIVGWCEKLFKKAMLRRGPEVQRVGGKEIPIAGNDPTRGVLSSVRNYIAESLLPVLILGDTGTGKELIARHIHELSGLPPANFRIVNCAAFTDSLFLSEIFGHTKGAFSDAYRNRLGLVLEAAGFRDASVSDDRMEELRGAVWDVLFDLSEHSHLGLVRGDFRSLNGLKKLLGLKSRSTDLKTIAENVDTAVTSMESFKATWKGCLTGLDADERDFVSWAKARARRPLEIHWQADEDADKWDISRIEDGETGCVCGTLFLDEIAELTPSAQAGLLRFLGGYGFRPVGYSGLALAPRVRIIGATNRYDLVFGANDKRVARLRNNDSSQPQATAPGSASISPLNRFRTDIFHRLANWVIDLSPLHERGESPFNYARKWGLDFGKRAPRAHKNRSFGLEPEAADLLKMWVSDKKFSGDPTGDPILTGNFRALEALIDRACWIAIGDGGQRSSIDVNTLKRALECVYRVTNQTSVEELPVGAVSPDKNPSTN